MHPMLNLSHKSAHKPYLKEFHPNQIYISGTLRFFLSVSIFSCNFFVTVHAYVLSNGICRGFAFKYGKFLLPPRFLTALSVPKVPTCEQYHFFPLTADSYFHSYRQSSIQTHLRPNISPSKSRCFLPLLLHLLFTLPLREHASAVILPV